MGEGLNSPTLQTSMLFLYDLTHVGEEFLIPPNDLGIENHY